MKDELEQFFIAIEKLQQKYSHHNKKFTLDGKLVGDIGEVLAAEYYGITLHKDNKAVYDGFLTSDSTKEVQIKSSFNNYFYFPKDLTKMPDYFIAININKDGTFEEIFNGRGDIIYKHLLSHLPTERKYPYRLSLNKLKELNLSDYNIDRINRIA